MNDIKTLEDLRIFLSDKFVDKNIENLTRKDILEITKKAQDIAFQYDLSADEMEYVLPIQVSNESQSNRKTLINTSKAQQIILRRKK